MYSECPPFYPILRMSCKPNSKKTHGNLRVTVPIEYEHPHLSPVRNVSIYGGQKKPGRATSQGPHQDLPPSGSHSGAFFTYPGVALNATTTYMLLYPLHFAGSGSSLWPPKRIIDWGGAPLTLRPEGQVRKAPCPLLGAAVAATSRRTTPSKALTSGNPKPPPSGWVAAALVSPWAQVTSKQIRETKTRPAKCVYTKLVLKI